jgi:3-methyl-2-oxobutanoate hydroxymethyltransferase
MSDHPKPLTTLDLVAMKRAGRKIVSLTAYDALMARMLDASGVDLILVGDSVNQVVAGRNTTLSATLDQMIYHARAVQGAVRRALVVVDLPFLSYQVTPEEAIRNAGRVLQETDAAAVKLEGGVTMGPTIRALVERGIPVMAHIGLTPQSVHALGGYRVQGREEGAAARLLADAHAVEEAGAFSVVLELVPSALAARVTKELAIPTVGIGAGAGCDGQVLVLPDMLGMNPGFTPKFLRRYADLDGTIRAAVSAYADDVRAGRYPGAEHGFE